MTNHNHQDPDALIDRAIDSLQHRAASSTFAEPTPAVVQQTLARLAAAQSDKPNINNTWRIPTMRLMTKLAVAAAVAIVVGVLAWTGGGPWSAQPAFADVLQKVKQVHSVRFKSEGTTTAPGATEPTTSVITTLIIGNRMRQEGSDGQFVNVVDFDSGQVLTLMTAQKRAIRMNMQNSPQQMKDQNLLEQFRNMPANAGKPIGKKEINGRMLDAYAVEEQGQKLTVWADPKTHLPLRMEATLEMPTIPKSEMVMMDFEWDVAADLSEISLEIPAGYAVQEMTVDASMPTETDLISALRTMATTNGGKFTDTFDMPGMLAAVKGAKQPTTRQTPDAMQKEITQKVMAVSRGLMFVQQSGGEDFHYAGKDVAMGATGRAVLWYRPAKSQTYRVIDADLTVRGDVKAAELPKVESQKLVSGTFIQTGEGTVVAPATKQQ
jgi:outer membrane lipoprotein-sorting protein